MQTNKNLAAERERRKWNHWLSVIHRDIRGVLIQRHIFREVRKIIEANSAIHGDSTFYDWMAEVYATSAVIAVRRQVDRHPKSISLARLLEEIKKNPKILSRRSFVSKYNKDMKYVGHHDFDEWSGPGRAYVSPRVIGKDLTLLKQKAARLRKFANKRIAHYDRASFRKLPTFAQLSDCLDCLEELLKKYLLLLRAESHTDIVPVWQYDWTKVFRQAWISDECS